MDLNKLPIEVSASAVNDLPDVARNERVIPVVLRGSAVKLSIPIDQRHMKDSDEDKVILTTTCKRNRRDSLERREALLKGREGSRRRQRWENDRLLNNPWVQPPLPCDWQVTPTHPVRIVPYFLAPLWEERLAARREEDRERRLFQARLLAAREGAPDAKRVAQDLRKKLKKTKSAKGLLHDLEEEVRSFVQTWSETRRHRRVISLESEISSDVAVQSDFSDDDIVFVGRNGKAHDEPPSPKASKDGADMMLVDTILAEKLVFGAPADDKAANFGRWLVHAIAAYYGLRAWSVTSGSPATRDAYVGIHNQVQGGDNTSQGYLPTPLWGLV